MTVLAFLENDIFCSAASGVLCALLLVLFGYSIARLVRGEKEDRLEYLKNYKKGRFIAIYIVAIPLYFLGILHTAQQTAGTGSFLLTCFLNAIGATLDLVKLDFGADGLIAYMVRNPVYYAAMAVLYVLTAVNVLLFSASLLWLRIRNFFGVKRAMRAGTVYVAVGDDENCLSLLRSVKDRGYRALLFAAPDADLKDRLFLEDIPYVTFDFRLKRAGVFGKKIERLFGRALNRGGPLKKNVNVFLATGSEEHNLLLMRELSSVLKKKRKVFSAKGGGCDSLEEIFVSDRTGVLKVYAFGELTNRSVYLDYVENSKAHFHYLNRYEMTATDFVGQYPITQFMDGRQIDFARGLIVQDCEINVILIGFGPTNRQIYQKLIADSQFFTLGKEGVCHKKVNYYIFDKNKAYRDKELNFGYLRYSREFLTETYPGSADRYFPLPDYPAADGTVQNGAPVPWEENAHFFECDVHDRRCLGALKDFFERKGNVYTYAIVAFGEDLENVDYARLLGGMLLRGTRGGGEQRTHLFAKVKRADIFEALSEESGRTDKNAPAVPVHPFGCCERAVYNIGKITEDHIFKMAQMKSFRYSREGRHNEMTGEAGRRAVETWMRYDLPQRVSNYFCILDLRLKLHLLGFDYIPKDPAAEDASAKYRAKYFASDDPKKQEALRHSFSERDERGVPLSDPFSDGSVRTELARQEHQRWNAAYIVQGFVPYPKDEIDKDRNKDIARLMHANLTSFEGLGAYRAFMLERGYGRPEVRHYDYEIMDICDLLLSDAGFQIVEKGYTVPEKEPPKKRKRKRTQE